MRLKPDILKKIEEGGYALCPFRVMMNYAPGDKWTLQDYLEYLQCLKEVCALYNRLLNCCGLHAAENTYLK